MHAVIVDGLEEYLAGILPPSAQRGFEAHLKSCRDCNRKVTAMREVAGLVSCLKTEEAVEVPPSFVVRVMQDVAQRPVPSFWSPFGDFAFARRVVFASLLTLAVLGTVLVSRETSYAPGPPTPAAVMASGQSSPTADRMLLTLASYDEP
jgi:anti-sigma factor RsiW